MPILGSVASAISGNLTPLSGYVSLASFTYTSATTATTTFSNIPQTFQHLEIRYSVAETTTNNNAFIYTYLNGDSSTSKYSTNRVRAFRYSISGGGSGPTNTYTGYSNLGYLVIGETTQDSPSSIIVSPCVGITQILNYTSTTQRKNYSSRYYQQAAATDYILGRSYGQYDSTSAVTSVTFGLDAFQFTTGSTFTLYGIK